ncbi:ABC transporter ATP-binding protein [Janibacter corallicola]|uniref:ABC transporter ATP-binding protein n=1 Tax=Janibacter corallicola TaxID=415212 RepID=UPI00082E09AE|nr:ABC transporter ATP-binding protein [Janibacter corallicola]
MLTVTGMTKAFGGRPVLRGLDVTVAKGEVVALVGPNGAGKSTALRCIVGADTPDEGEVLLDDAALDTRRPTTRSALCAVLGDFGVMPELTVTEHLDLLARAHSVASPGQVVDEALAGARIEHVADQLPSTLSSGQAQRFALATAMVRPWELLLADEPEQRLDDAGRQWLGDWLAGHAATGRSVLMACHDPDVVAGSGARVVTLAGED